MSVKNWTLAKAGESCYDCDRECETVNASYILNDGTPVCDSHLEIRAETEDEDMGLDTAESLNAEALAEVELVEGNEDDAFDIHASRQTFPDYADIQRLENMAWSMPEGDNSHRQYAREYHKLATEYSETTLIEAIEQYYNGKPW